LAKKVLPVPRRLDPDHLRLAASCERSHHRICIRTRLRLASRLEYADRIHSDGHSPTNSIPTDRSCPRSRAAPPSHCSLPTISFIRHRSVAARLIRSNPGPSTRSTMGKVIRSRSPPADPVPLNRPAVFPAALPSPLYRHLSGFDPRCRSDSGAGIGRPRPSAHLSATRRSVAAVIVPERSAPRRLPFSANCRTPKVQTA
jgi:hypothetical protein